MHPRKPLIYLAVSLPMLVAGSILVLVALLKAFTCLHGIAFHSIPDLNGFLISIPALLVWIPWSLLLSNAVLRHTPYLKDLADRYADESSTPGYAQSQHVLLRLAILFSVIGIPIIAFGFIYALP